MVRASSGTHPSPVASRGIFSAAVVLTALVAVLAFPLADTGTTAAGRFCQAAGRAEATRADAVTGSGDSVLVVGDSWSAGWRLARPAGSWPAALPGRVHVDGFPGSGFSEHASPCGRVAFADRVGAALRRSDARLVVVQGGLNDFDQSDADIAAGFHRVMRALHGREVLVVGPASAPSRAARVPRVDALLRSLAMDAGVAYVASSDLDLPYLRDRLHLTAAGHRAYGAEVARRIERIRSARALRPGMVPAD